MQQTSRITGFITLIFALLVMIGWHTKNLSLVQLHPSFVPMQYNTALGFVLSAGGLLIISWRYYRWAVMLGTAIILLAGLTFLQYVFNINLGIDELFITHFTHIKTVAPGRMAPNTALCFFLIGGMLILAAAPAHSVRQINVLRTLGSTNIAFSAVSLVGFLTSNGISGWPYFTSMAVPTSLCFIVMSAGLMLSCPKPIHQINERIPSWLVGTVIGLLFLLSLALWLGFRNEENNRIKRELQERADNIGLNLRASVMQDMKAIRRMAHRWESDADITHEAWSRDARHYLQDQPLLTALMWVDGERRVRRIEAKDSSAARVLQRQMQASLQNKPKPWQEDLGLEFFTPAQTGRAMILGFARIPGREQYIVSLFDIQNFAKVTLPPSFHRNFYIYIANNGSTLLNASDPQDLYTAWAAESSLALLNKTLLLKIWPKQYFLTNQSSVLPTITLILGVSLCAMFASFYFAYISHQQASSLRDKESRIRSVMNTVLDGLITINDKGIVESFNKAASRIFGYEQEEVIGKNVKVLMPEPYHSEHDRYLRNYLDTGHAKVIGIGREVSAKRKDGSVFPMELGINEMKIQGKRMFVGTIRDITERKQAELYNQALVNRLTQSNTELERFAYVASHDMQEPLRMVTNFSQMITRDYAEALDETGKEYLHMVRASGERMRDMVEDLLEYAKLGHEATHMMPVDGTEEIKHVLENLRELIAERQAMITYDTLPSFYGNPVQFMRLLQNLIANAIKYQKPGSIPKIHVSVTEEPHSWRISVQDNGIGIDEVFVAQVFEPFRRLHGWDAIKGTGIGLAVCKRIAENHGGTIWVQSVPHEGSTFYFTISKYLYHEAEAA